MFKKWIFLGCWLLPFAGIAQLDYEIVTADIDRFWLAFDRLKTAGSKNDSIRIIQEEYIDKASKPFKKFIKARNFTAEEYVALIPKHPRFWQSIRPLTENLKNRTQEIDLVYRKFQQELPGFKAPDVCLAIGCMRTGGTTSKNLLLIGAEIAAADASVDKSELNQWLKGALGSSGIVAYVAHETVHTQQSGFPVGEIFKLMKHKKLNLLNASLNEGVADFITDQFLDLNINRHIHQYGDQHSCELWKEFEKSFAEAPFDYSKWLYNGTNSADRPADLGYYIGYKVAASYFEKQADKRKALKTLLKRGKYKRVFKGGNFPKESCG